MHKRVVSLSNWNCFVIFVIVIFIVIGFCLVFFDCPRCFTGSPRTRVVPVPQVFACSRLAVFQVWLAIFLIFVVFFRLVAVAYCSFTFIVSFRRFVSTIGSFVFLKGCIFIFILIFIWLPWSISSISNIFINLKILNVRCVFRQKFL